jgi:hypothetical protein
MLHSMRTIRYSVFTGPAFVVIVSAVTELLGYSGYILLRRRCG